MSQDMSFKHHMILLQNVEESCTFQKIYGVLNVKLKTKWSGRHENTNLVENLKEIN